MSKIKGKHRIAKEIPIGTSVPPQLVREYLDAVISPKGFSRLTDKILGRPPVKFVFSTVCDILSTTGHDKDLLERLQSRGIATKDDRVACMKMLSDSLTKTAGYTSSLVIASKVCAGKQVDRTRLMISVCGHLASGNEGDKPAPEKPPDEDGGGDSVSAEEQGEDEANASQPGGAKEAVDENADIQLQPAASSSIVHEEILKEWEALSTGDAKGGDASAKAAMTWQDEDAATPINYMMLMKDAARSAFHMAEKALSTKEGLAYLKTEAQIFSEIDAQNIYMTEIERVEPTDKLGAQFKLSATVSFWGFTSRQFVSIKKIAEPSDGLKCNSPIMEAELQVGDVILRVDDCLITSGQEFAAAIDGKTYMQVAYMRPESLEPDTTFFRQARKAIDSKIRRTALNVVQSALNWIRTFDSVSKKKKVKINVIDIVKRLQRKFRFARMTPEQKRARREKGAFVADVVKASSRRAARRRKRSKKKAKKAKDPEES